jgi:hypothetical protein
MALTRDDKKFIEDTIDQKLDEKLDSKLTALKDDFYTRIDPILKEVVASREDRLIGTEQHIRNEKRIEKLEKIHPQGTHAVSA